MLIYSQVARLLGELDDNFFSQKICRPQGLGVFPRYGLCNVLCVLVAGFGDKSGGGAGINPSQGVKGA